MGYESGFLVGGLVVGMLLGWVLAVLFGPRRTASGMITITSVTPSGNDLTIGGNYTALEGTHLLRLYSYVHNDLTENPSQGSEPYTGSQEHDKHYTATSGSFTITHLNGNLATCKKLFVFGGFGVHGHGAREIGPCGSGSGSGGHMLPAAMTEPAARQYRLTPEGTSDPGTSPEVRRALERPEVILAFDQRGAASGEGVWSEPGVSAAEPLRWRLNLRTVRDQVVATLELVGGPGPALVWRCPQWHAFGSSKFVADPATAAGRLLPGLEVRSV